MDNQLATDVVKLLAFSLWTKYQAYCPHSLDLFFPEAFQADPEHKFEKHLFETMNVVQNSLDDDYEVQIEMQQAGEDPFSSVDDMVTDNDMFTLSRSLNINDVTLRLCLELFAKKPMQFQNGIDESIRSGYFQELAGHFYSDLELLDNATIFSSGETLLSLHRDSDPDTPPQTIADGNSHDNQSMSTDKLIEAIHQLTALRTTILGLRRYFFDVPIRYEHEIRMWRYTRAGETELLRRREVPDPGISGELKRVIRLNVELAIGHDCQYMRRE